MRKLTRVLAFALVLVLIGGMLTGCNQAGKEENASASPTEAKQAQGDNLDTIKIGSIHPLTGAMAYEGQQMVYGQEMIIDMINEAGGIKSMGGRKLELVAGDSQGLADVAASTAERLINDGCIALTGCYNSAATMTATQVAEISEVPFVISISSSMELMIRGYKWSFRIQPNTQVFVKNFIKYLGEIKTDDMKTLGIIYEDSITGYTTAKYVMDNVDKTGLKLVGSIPYSATTTSLSAEVTKLQQLKPDVLLPISYYQDGAMMFREILERNMSFKLVIGIVNAAFYDKRFIDEFGSNTDGIVNINYAFDLTQGPGKELADKFKAKYNQDIQPSTLYACYSIWVLADALERAGTDDNEALRKALSETNYKDDLMTFESIKFDETGENINAAGVMIQVQGGKSLIVYPEEYAQTEMKKGSWPLK